MKAPTQRYKDKQRRLGSLTGIENVTREQREERQILGRELYQEFMREFKLEPDKGRLTARFFGRFENTDFAPRSNIFDHKDFFRRGANLVIVSQPYGIDEEELRRWTKDVGATYTISSEWGYYFPGRADLFLVKFTPAAKAAFDQRLRQRR